MATANRIIIPGNNPTIREAQPHQYNRGNGRRYRQIPEPRRSSIPESVQVTDHATHETNAQWRGGQESTNTKGHPIIIVMGNADGTGRPNQSKIMITADRKEAYAFATWSDMFGVPVKENAPMRGQGGHKWRPIIRLSDEARDAAWAAAQAAGAE